MANLKFPLPICSKCLSVVERMEQHQDISRDGLHITVYCHGKAETMFISSHSLVEATAIFPGHAFKSEEAFTASSNT